MASQALSNFKVEYPQSFMLRDILPGAGWAPYTAPVRELTCEADLRSAGDEQEGSCVKGFLVGIFLEGIVAAGIYGVWHMWHVIR